jgi:hypothetical protein
MNKRRKRRKESEIEIHSALQVIFKDATDVGKVRFET